MLVSTRVEKPPIQSKREVALQTEVSVEKQQPNLPPLPSTGTSKGRKLKLKKKVIYTYEYESDDEPPQNTGQSLKDIAAGQRPKEKLVPTISPKSLRVDYSSVDKPAVTINKVSNTGSQIFSGAKPIVREPIQTKPQLPILNS